jgi:hypothetical protein
MARGAATAIGTFGAASIETAQWRPAAESAAPIRCTRLLRTVGGPAHTARVVSPESHGRPATLRLRRTPDARLRGHTTACFHSQRAWQRDDRTLGRVKESQKLAPGERNHLPDHRLSLARSSREVFR